MGMSLQQWRKMIAQAQGSQNLQADKLKSFMGDIGGMSDLARNFVSTIEGGAEGLEGKGKWAEPLAEKEITRRLEDPGMGAAEKAQRVRGINRNFGASTRSLAGASGGSGFFSAAGVGQGAGGEPAGVMASELADLEAEDARLARTERGRGLDALTTLTPGMMDSAAQPQQAFGAMMGDMYRSQQPQRYRRASFGPSYSM